MRLLLCFMVCLLSITAYAKPYVITSITTIRTDNWYPLAEAEMKAAVVDTALAEFTKTGRFNIIQGDTGLQQARDGKLRFDISLIGPAEVVKLTTTLSMKDNATYVSTVSIDIHNMDYQGIYDTFEYVGEEAAKRLNAKITLLKAHSPAVSPVGSNSEKPKPEILSLFNQAQSYKRKDEFHKARAIFEQVIAESSAAEKQWRDMSVDELRYGLPIFEADNLMLSNNFQAPLLVREKMAMVSHLYRQILADNTDNPLRVLGINRRLDQMSMSQRSLSNSLKGNSLSRVTPLRMILLEYYLDAGSWPELPMIKQQFMSYTPDMDVVSYRSDGDTMELIVKDVQSDVKVKLSGKMGRVSIELN